MNQRVRATPRQARISIGSRQEKGEIIRDPFQAGDFCRQRIVLSTPPLEAFLVYYSFP